MINMLTIFASSFVIALSGAMMPGPLLTAVIAGSTRRGFSTGPLMIAGHAVLELVLVIALLTGLAPFFQLPAVFIVIAVAGSLILLWMAFGMFRGLPSLSLSFKGQDSASDYPVFKGIIMSLSNPYWIIWWATIGIGYIFYSQKFGITGIGFFFAGHILGDLAWYSFIAAAVAGGKRFFTDKIYRWLIGICASFLVIFAFYFAFSGIEKLVNIL